MIDWFVVLGGLAVLPIVALLYFVGCGHLLTVAPDDPQPAPGGAPPPPPPPPPTPPPASGPTTVPVAPPVTTLETGLAADVNDIKAGGTNDKVESVLATWTLSKKTGGPVAQSLDETVVRTDASRPFLDPMLDPPAIRVLTDAQVALYDQVKCDCVVTTKPVAGGPATTSTATAIVDLAAATQQVFRLAPNWATLTAKPRKFDLVVVPPAAGPLPTTPTRLQLNPSKDINEIVTGGRSFKVVSIKVTWTLTKAAGAPMPVPQLLHETIVRADSTRIFLDLALDPAAMWDLSADQIGHYGFVTCGCEVTTRTTAIAGTTTETSLATPTSPVVIVPQYNRVFLLIPKWTNPVAVPRQFQVIVQ